MNELTNKFAIVGVVVVGVIIGNAIGTVTNKIIKSVKRNYQK